MSMSASLFKYRVRTAIQSMLTAELLIKGKPHKRQIVNVYSVDYGLAVDRGETVKARLMSGSRVINEYRATLLDAWLVSVTDRSARRVCFRGGMLATEVATAVLTDPNAQAVQLVNDGASCASGALGASCA